MSLNDFNFEQIEAIGDPMKQALLTLESARREFDKSKTYERAVQVQLAEKKVSALASINRREIKIV